VWSKPDKNSPHKIDAAIAAAIALDRASWYAENATGALDPELVVL